MKALSVKSLAAGLGLALLAAPTLEGQGSFVSIAPAGYVVVGQTSVSITIKWCGFPPNSPDPINTRVIKVNGVDVTASFDFQNNPEACGFSGPISEENLFSSTGTITVNQSTGPVEVYTDMSNGIGDHYSAIEQFFPPTPRLGVAVTPSQQFVTARPSEGRVERFTIRNTGAVSDSFGISVSGCGSGAIGSCSLSSSKVTLAAGASTTVTASYTASGTVGSTGLIWLRASNLGWAGIGSDSSWTELTVQAAPAAGVEIAGLAPGLNDVVSRPSCVTVALVEDVASECGDLRMVHPLPAVRTMGMIRQPTLLYNSQHAHPNPLILADVTLSGTVSLPGYVYVCLTIGGNPTCRNLTPWYGTAGWSSPGATRRVAVQGTGSWSSGPVDFSLEFSASSPNNQGPYIANGRMYIVNRSTSSFGAGWWLAGLEQLQIMDTTVVVWTGGDGSVRRYAKDGGGVYRGPSYAALDSIQKAGTSYVRRTAEHASVYFNATGRHDSTVNALGHVTRFSYAGSLLSSIVVPGISDTLAYTFGYDGNGRLTSVTAPGNRITTVFRNAAFVDSIKDPDGAVVRFTSLGGYYPNLIYQRKNRRNYTTSFQYNSTGARLSQVTRPLGTILLSPGEVKGYSPIHLDSTYSLVDGPRTDVDDATRFWLNGYGAPWRIRNALGQETRIRYSTTWPGLADSVRGPNRFVSRAYYSAARGLLDSTKALNPLGTGSDAATKLQWHSSLNRVVSVRDPMGVRDTMAYNADGTTTWEQRGTDSARRVRFYYNSSKLPESITLPEGGGAAFAYSPLGNLRKEQSALGLVTFTFQDAMGRDTAVSTPRDVGTLPMDSATVVDRGVRHSAVLDVMGRATRSITIGRRDTMPNGRIVPADTVRLDVEYDLAGC